MSLLDHMTYPRESGEMRLSSTVAKYPAIAAALEMAYKEGRLIPFYNPLEEADGLWEVVRWQTVEDRGVTYWSADLRLYVAPLR